MDPTLSLPQQSGDRRDADQYRAPMSLHRSDERADTEETGHDGLLPLRVSALRFLALFAIGFGTWCAALLIARSAAAHVGLAIGLGFALADFLACLGVLAARWFDLTEGA